MKNYQIVTIGGATRDIVFFTSESKIIHNPHDLIKQTLIGFEYGAKIISPKACYGFGGGGCNTAVCLSRLGQKVASIVCLGDDREGDSIKKNLVKEKVDTSLIKIKEKETTGFSFFIIDEKTKEHVAFLFRGANDHLDLSERDLDKFKAKWFYVSSLSGKNWLSISSKIIQKIKKDKTKLAWNPGETQLKSGKRGLIGLLKYCDILSLNKSESIELVLSGKGKIKYINNPRTLLKEIYNWGPKIFILTDGRNGAYAYDGRKIYFSKIYDIPVLDTTGAGDCFGSSFLAGLLLYKGDIKKALQMGIYNTAGEVSKVGAQNGLLTLSQIKKFI
jgi:ribokinase